MSGECGDCKHWHPEQIPYQEGWGQCALADHRYLWGLTGQSKPRFEKVGDGFLATAQDFGCVEFEAK